MWEVIKRRVHVKKKKEPAAIIHVMDINKALLTGRY